MTNSVGVTPVTSDPDFSNNNFDLVTLVTAEADLRVVKTALPTQLVVGQDGDYSVTVLNLGPSAAVNVQLTDTLPAGITLKSVSSPDCIVTNGQLICDFGDFDGLSGTSLTVGVTFNDPGIHVNTAGALSIVLDPNLANNTDSAIVEVFSVLEVDDSIPVNGSANNALNQDVTVNFNRDINDASVTAGTFTVVGDLQGVYSGTVLPSSGNIVFIPDMPYLPGERITVTLTDAIEDALGVPIRPHVLQFDVLAIGCDASVLVDSRQALGAFDSEAVEMADLDGDGDLDAVFANAQTDVSRVYTNAGAGSYGPAQTLTGVNFSRDLELGDMDGDGDVDAVFARWSGSQANLVLINTAGTLADSGQNLGGQVSAGVSLGDVDMDGDLDAVFANIGGLDQVYINNGAGTLSDSGQGLGIGDTRDVAVGDIDTDGDLDIVLAADLGPGQLRLHQ